MKVSICVFSFLILASTIRAQEAIYGDQFDSGALPVGEATGYQVSLENQTFRIMGTGSAPAWSAIRYDFHDGSGSEIVVNAATTPKLYLKAKGENRPNLRVDFLDNSGYVTNQNATTVTLEEDYNIYELDYTDRLLDGAFGGPCTTAPCVVDASQLLGLIFFINAPEGGYEGNVDIDWLSIGTPLEEAPPPAAYEIRYNQVSYLTNRKKIISIVSANATGEVPYQILDEEGREVRSGTSTASSFWAPSQEYVASIDFSDLNIVGTYRMITEEAEATFQINDDGYAELSKASLKYFYFNRASTSISEALGGEYARPFGHPDDEVRIHSSAATANRPVGTIISAPKGWYDAGDYNKYIVNSGISTYTLLAAYEHYQDYYNAFEMQIPEKGGDLPDVLDEVRWNLEWMLAMQDPDDGGVYHKLTGLNFSGIIMPHQYNFDRYVVQKTTAAALNFAAVTAVASRIFEEFELVNPGFSASLLEAAKKAYAWAKANPTTYYQQPSDVRTGTYGDGNVTDEFDWAAAELYITSEDNQFLTDLNMGQLRGGVPAWPFVSPLAIISLNHHRNSLEGDIDLQAIEEKLVSTANQLKSSIETSAMQVAMGSNNFFWGSNGEASNQIIILIRAYETTGDSSYLEAAYVGMDYLLGRNGTGYCFVSGFGDKSPLNPHHRVSESDGVDAPVPGMVAGGPNPGQQDNCSGYPNNNPASSYVDDWCSYASNEVTINWNAPLAYAINALRFYQNQGTDRVTSVQENLRSSWEIAPNPVASQLQVINSTFLNNPIPYQISSISGKVIANGRIMANEPIDLSSILPGLYIFTVFEAGSPISLKFIKQ